MATQPESKAKGSASRMAYRRALRDAAKAAMIGIRDNGAESIVWAK